MYISDPLLGILLVRLKDLVKLEPTIQKKIQSHFRLDQSVQNISRPTFYS